jgi:hypothetical protein
MKNLRDARALEEAWEVDFGILLDDCEKGYNIMQQSARA